MLELKNRTGQTVLTVRRVTPTPQIETWEHGVIWRGVDELVIDLGDAHWYGQGALTHQLWPLEKLAQYPQPFITSDNGATGLLGIQEPFWITSRGAGVWVQDDTLTTSFNAPISGQPPEHSFTAPVPCGDRPLNAALVQTDRALTIRGQGLTVRFFTLDNARDVVEAFWQLITISAPPPDDIFIKPIWTTWANFKSAVSHDVVIQFIDNIHRHGFACDLLGIDDRWQAFYGSSQFDASRFPDPHATVEAAAQRGVRLTLWTAPYIEEASENFAAGAAQGCFFKTPDGQPYIGRWWVGPAGFVDTSRAASMDWYLGNFKTQIMDRYGLHGLKIDGGEAMFYQDDRCVIPGGLPLNAANHSYVAHAARYFPWSDTRSGWRNQAAPMLFRQWDKSSAWGFDNGLASCITQALTLNLLGYSFSFPDMVGGNLYGSQIVTAELMIRWAQAVAPMPLIQFSLAPWDYGEECARLCARYSRLHEELAARNIALARQRAPIVRPVWWIAPQDEAALTCDDAYLIGDDLLVAPVITEGARQRDIYLPPGQWRSYWHHGEVHQGGAWLHAYPAPLDTLPLFERVARV